jgi:outer membrane immunogenic protein
MKQIIKAGIAGLALSGAMQPAAAADLEVKGPGYRTSPFHSDPWTWAGFNIGLNAGYSAGPTSAQATFTNGVTGPFTLPPGSVTSVNFNLHGGVVGGQVGYNWQVATYVGGIETDIQWSGQNGAGNFVCAATAGGGAFGPCSPALTFTPPGATGVNLALEQKLSWFGTLRGRIGSTFTPRVVGYLTGGLAYGEIKTAATLGALTANGAAVASAFNSSIVKGGWTIGAGVEGRFVGNWSGKLEYLYVDLGNVSGAVVNAPGLIAATFSSHVRDNILRVGLNYRFYSQILDNY